MLPAALRIIALLLVTAVPALAAVEAQPATRFNGVVLWQSGQGPDRVAVQGRFDPLRRRGTLGADTPLHIGSITKLFTAVLVMQQVAEGRLSLDATIGELLPELPPDHAAITVRQLLQHRSGLQEWNAEQVTFKDGTQMVVPTVPSALLNREILIVAGVKLREPPGQFFYNNLDYLLLGVLLERLTGKPYTSLLDAQLLTPLHLKHTGLATAPRQSRMAKVAPAVQVENGVLKAPPVTALSNYGAAGAMVSTAADLSRFAAALIDGRILPSAERDALFAEGLSVWSYDFADPLLTSAVPAVERQGAVGSYRSTLVLLPRQRGWLIVLGNSDDGDYSTWIAGSFTHRLLAQLLDGEPLKPALKKALESAPVKPAATP